MSKASDKAAALLDALDSHDKPTIRAAVDALISLAAIAPDIKATFNERLVDPQRKNHWPIAYVLAHLSDPPESALRVLLEALGHPDADIRWAIALLLIRLAKENKIDVRSLLNLLNTGTPTQRRMAVYCVRDLKLEDRESLKGLLRSLHDVEPTVRVAATTSFKHRNDVDAEIKNRLLELFLNDPDGRVRNAVAITLAQLGSPSAEFVTALERSSRSDDWGLRKAANAALDLLKIKRSAPSGS